MPVDLYWRLCSAGGRISTWGIDGMNLDDIPAPIDRDGDLVCLLAFLDAYLRHTLAELLRHHRATGTGSPDIASAKQVTSWPRVAWRLYPSFSIRPKARDGSSTRPPHRTLGTGDVALQRSGGVVAHAPAASRTGAAT